MARGSVRRRSRGCSVLRRMWVGVFAVFAVVSVSTRRSPPRTNSHSPPARRSIVPFFPLPTGGPTHHPHRGFHHRPVDEETKLELPLREEPCSLSIGLDLDHELLALLSTEHSREASLSCLTHHSPLTTPPLAANSDSSRPLLQWRFSVPLK